MLVAEKDVKRITSASLFIFIIAACRLYALIKTETDTVTCLTMAGPAAGQSGLKSPSPFFDQLEFGRRSYLQTISGLVS